MTSIASVKGCTSSRGASVRRPPGAVDFGDAEVTAVTIAHWFKSSRQSLAYVPQLAGPLTDLALDGITDVLVSEAIPDAVVAHTSHAITRQASVRRNAW